MKARFFNFDTQKMIEYMRFWSFHDKGESYRMIWLTEDREVTLVLSKSKYDLISLYDKKCWNHGYGKNVIEKVI